MPKLGTYKVTGIPLKDKLTAGNSFFVDSNIGVNESTVYGSKPDRPFATIDYAINQCVSGDTIYVMERHAENLATTAALIPDVKKITITGIGREGNRPVVSTVTGTSGANKSIIGITGAGTRIENITFRCNQAAGSSGNLMRIAADDVTIDNCRFDHASTAKYFTNTIEVATGSDRVVINNSKFVNTGTSGQSAKAIDLSGTGATFDLSLTGNEFRGLWTTAIINGSTDYDMVGWNISKNILYNNSTIASDYLIKLSSSAQTGKGGRGNIMSDNLFCISTTAASTGAVAIAPTCWQGGRNKFFNSTGGKYDPGFFSS